MPADRLPGEEDDDDEDEDMTPRFQPDSSLSILIRGGQSPTSSTTPSIPGHPPPMITLPAPATHYGPGPMAEPSIYMDLDDNSMQVTPRRPSMYHASSSSDYPVPMYPNPTTTTGPSWHQTTTAPPTASLFPFAQHSQATLPLPPPVSQAHSAGYVSHMDAQSQFLGSAMDGLPHPGSLFRGGGGSPTHGHGHSAYGRQYGH